MRPLRLLTYNVRYFGHATRGLVSTKRAMTRIAEAIASLSPLADLVCLQEVETRSFRSNVAHPAGKEGPTQLERMMGMLREALAASKKPDAYEAYYFPAHKYRVAKDAHIYTTGLAVLAHHDYVVDHHNAGAPADITHRGLHALRGLKQTRICAHVRFRHKQGHPIDVFNTHLSLPSAVAKEFWTSPARMGWGKNQLQEARNLAKFIEAERKSDRFVVVGDFNALPGSPVYQLLVDELGYTDPFARLHKMSAEELRAWPTAGFMQLRMHLDHILTGPGLEWLDFEESAPFGERSSSFHGLSDHMPLIGRCRIKGARHSVPPGARHSTPPAAR
jgi:endonuclease/exonuclease/phosphatase family metal-dependent hydrolase